MRRLTIKQRAQRATNRINKVVAVKYPLLAEQLSTTVAEQEQRIAQKDADFQTHWGKLQEFDEAISELGIDRREAVCSVVDLVSGITLQNPADEADPNGHHVSVIAWQFRSAIDIPPVVMPPVTEVGYATIKRQSIADVLAGIDAQIAALTEVRREIAGWLGK